MALNTAHTFSVIRRKRENESIIKAVECITERFYSLPEIKQRATTKVVKRFLIEKDSLIIKGSLYSTHSKSIGAGVHEIFLKRINQTM